MSAVTDHFTDLSLARPAGAAGSPAPLSRDGWSLAVVIFAAQMLVVILVVVGLAVATYQHQAQVIQDDKQATVATISITLANDPFVAEALAGENPTELLQPYTNKILDRGQGVDFITIMTPDALRVTHPNPEQLGKQYSGSIRQAQAGQTYNEVALGTLGLSVRTIAPVYYDGELVGMVATGITLESLESIYRSELPQILAVSALALLLAGFSSWSFSRYVNQATLGFGPHGLRRLYAFYFSALHSVREGLVLLDRRHRIVLYNQEASRLLGFPRKSLPADWISARCRFPKPCAP
ncbi:sensor histidine kinase [Glutamicibacter arilaitensis]|uniref:PAS domain-containing protein n=1 Tax=Glutamicibacter arilaitensis TaxID=256701 RepID=A0A4Y8TZU5_9MICC|nr:PAS domain-containing protein [Glutamicibacter arilaitensis]TFH57650.1 PAS domain-containing protein [Glutamicibacter arilaitensis]